MSEPISLTREQLHELVWQTPLIRLGERFGISGNGLKKICQRLDVPVPPVGWWAKKAAGHRVRITLLAPAHEGKPVQATITATPPEAGGLRDAVRDGRRG